MFTLEGQKKLFLMCAISLSGASAAVGVGYQELLDMCAAVPTERQLVMGSIESPPQLQACEELLKAGVGTADAGFYLGRNLYLLGYAEQAQQQFELAAAAGSIKAVTALARLAEIDAIGAGQGLAEAVRLYEQASELGDPVAKMLLGILLEERVFSGPEPIDNRVLELYEDAARLGYPAAYFFLAELHRTGKSGKKVSREHVIGLYRKAAEGGVEPAVEALLAMGERPPVEDKTDSVSFEKLASDYMVFWRP